MLPRTQAPTGLLSRDLWGIRAIETSLDHVRSGISVRTITDSGEWDAAIWAHPRGNIFASWLWGEYKSRTGWKVHRLAILDGADDILALAQYHERTRGPVRIVRIQGGPLLTDKGARRAERCLQACFSHLRLSRFDVVLIDFERSQCSAATSAVLAQGFTPVVTPIRHTIDVDLTVGLRGIEGQMESRWRKVLRRVERTPSLSARFVEDVEERLACFDAFSVLYSELKKQRGFSNSFDCAAYRDLAARDPRHLFVEVRDRGELVLIRIAHLTAERCTDFFTASTDRARASGAATLAIWRLIEHASAAGCKVFDHGGIDPAANRGVYEFKRGLSQNVVLAGPIWVHSRSSLLQKAVAVGLGVR